MSTTPKAIFRARLVTLADRIEDDRTRATFTAAWTTSFQKDPDDTLRRLCVATDSTLEDALRASLARTTDPVEKGRLCARLRAIRTEAPPLPGEVKLPPLRKASMPRLRRGGFATRLPVRA